jgi:hypothetical protein
LNFLYIKLVRVDYHGSKEVPKGTCHAIIKSAEIKKKLKDIHALISKYDIDLIAVQAGYTPSDKRLVSISTLLFNAFTEMNDSINRRAGFSEAFRTIAREDSIEIPV